jgi:4-amino-4-deoxy-L-arabinose transferase-like glycosyltransferase
MTSTDALIDRMAGAIVARAPWLLRPARALMTARGFFVFLSVLMLALLLIRSLAFPGTGGDDSEQIVFAQYLSIGYYPRNPPLYAWLVHGAQYVFGVSVMAVSAVKFLAVWGSCAVLFACGRLLYRDDRIAALAALSPLAAYLLFWDGVTGLSNSILVMLPCALSFYAVLRLYAAPQLLWYLALGIFAGLGFLSKYGYGVFLVSLLAAAALDRTARARLLRLESLLALAALAAIVTPYALWFVDKRSATMSTDATVGIVPGLGFLASAAIGASAPLWILLPLFFPQAFGRIGGGTGNGPPESGALRQLMGRQLAVALVLFAITGAVSGLKARGYYMSVMILLPLYVFARVQAAGWRESAAALFALTAAAIPAGAALALAGQAYLEPYWCKKCERQLPYDAWSRQLRMAGFLRGTIVADWWPYPLAGNFKIRFPGSRMVTVKHPYAIAPAAAIPGSCLLLWGAPERRADVIAFANAHLSAGIEGETVRQDAIAPIRFTHGKHFVTLYFLLLRDGAGECR